MLWGVFIIAVVALVASVVALGVCCLLVIAIFRGSLDSFEGLSALAKKLRSVLEQPRIPYDESNL